MIDLKTIAEQVFSAEGLRIPNYTSLDDVDNELTERSYNRFINLVNSALSDINDRLPNSKRELLVNTTKGKLEYKLTEANSVSNNGFIEDSGFGEVTAITGVYSYNYQPLRFNPVGKQEFDKYMKRTLPTYRPVEEVQGAFYVSNRNVLITPFDLDNTTLRVSVIVGVQLVDKIPLDKLTGFDLGTINIDLPYSFLMAIVYYVVSRMQSPYGASQIGQTQYNASTDMYNKYVNEIGKLINTEMFVEEIIELNTFDQQGFC